MSATAIATPAAATPSRPNGPLALRLARRELRGGLKGFRIFLACLLLGVAAIAGVGSLSSAMLDGLAENGRALLGGEVELRLIHRKATDVELAWLQDNSGQLSQTAEMRGMARNVETPDVRRLVELKAVDGLYPLYGEATTNEGIGLEAALEQRDGVWGVLVDEGLLFRLDREIGDRIGLGEVEYEIRGTVDREPDRAARAFTLGPRAMVALESLAETGLEQPGALIYYHYRVDLPAGETLDEWRGRLSEDLPGAGWRIRDLQNAAPGLADSVRRVALFMTLVGLTALLVGGVGIANAVRAFLDEKRATIATLKCLGAPAFLIFQTYLLQVLALASLGIVAGLALGAAVPLAAAPFLEARMGFDFAGGVYGKPLLEAAAFGVLTTLVFSLWPLARAQQIPAGSLFRDMIQRARALPPAWALGALAVASAALAALAILGADERRFAAGFVIGAVAALIAFRLAALGVIWLAKRLPRVRYPGLRLAIANLHRPGAPTGNVVMSLGLGLTVLVAIALVEGNLRNQVVEEMPEEAPGFYFIDIQPEQVEDFKGLVRGFEGVDRVESVPMLRGRIVGVNGQRPEDMNLPEDIQWVFRGDRGLTWAREQPERETVVRGDWWPADYDGAPLVSLYEDIYDALGLQLGDRLTINILGRDVEVEIANVRTIDWSALTINFVMIFSPGLLESAPQTSIATVHLDAAQETPLERAVTDAFPNISAIRVKEALAGFAQTLRDIATAVSATASVTVLAGVLVLAGAVAAGHHRRIYDSVVLKVLGATRSTVGKAFLLEYGLMGLVTAVIAAVIGTAAGWVIVTQVMEIDFSFLPLSVAATMAIAVGVTLLFGFAGTFRALSVKAAPLLRNE
ncbi:MAG: ABC transporter permease [Kiloniellales bacterium]